MNSTTQKDCVTLGYGVPVVVKAVGVHTFLKNQIMVRDF